MNARRWNISEVIALASVTIAMSIVGSAIAAGNNEQCKGLCSTMVCKQKPGKICCCCKNGAVTTCRAIDQSLCNESNGCQP